jgi:16S rRNA (guanine527-N7)-methyltransferase
MVLALSRPDVHVILLEPLLRRTVFLEETIADLDLSNAVVRRSRAEDEVGRLVVDVVTARAVAPLDRLAAWALPLCRPGGELLALKGESASEELATAQAQLTRLGATSSEVVQVGAGIVDPLTTVVRVVAGTRAGRRRTSAQRKG